MSLRRFIGGVVAGALLFSNTSLYAAGPLDVVPTNAAIVGRLKAPQTTLEKTGAFVNQGAPGLGFLVLSQAGALGAAISNTTLGGVDLSKDWYFAAFVEKNAPPTVVFLVPATDEKDLKEAVGSGFTFVSGDGFVAYSEDAAAAELIANCKAGKSKSITTLMDKRATSLADESELSVFVNIARLRETYSEELIAADKQLDDALEGIKALTAGAANQTPGINLDAVWDMYGSLGHKVLQGVRDSDSFTLGLKVNNDALTIEELLVVGKDSASDKFLQSHPASDMALMLKQPQSQIAYFGASGNSSGVMQWAMDMSAKMIAGNEESKKHFDKVRSEMASVKYGSITGSMGLTAPTAEGILSAAIVMEATPATKLREIGRTASNAFKVDIPGVKQEITVKPDAEKVGDLTVDVMQMKQEYGEDFPGAELQNKILSVVYGKSGLTQRMTVNKNLYLQTIGGGADNMKSIVASLDAPSSGNPSAVAKSRARQLEKANFLMMLDLPNLVVKVAGIAEDLSKKEIVPPLPPQFSAAQLKAAKVDASYITFAAGAEPQGLRLRSEIPSGTIGGFFKIYQAVSMGGRGPRGR